MARGNYPVRIQVWKIGLYGLVFWLVFYLGRRSASDD